MISTRSQTEAHLAANSAHFDGNLDQMRLLDLYDAMSAATGGLDLSIDADAIERMLDEPTEAEG
jgi:hypothetical protein